MSSKIIKFVKWFDIIQALLFFAWGALGVFFSSVGMNSFDRLIAIYFFIAGAVSVYFGWQAKEDESFSQFATVRGCLYLIMSLIVSFFLQNLAPLYSIILGVFLLCVTGARSLYVHTIRNNRFSLTYGLCLVIGLVLIASSHLTEKNSTWLFSVALIMMGLHNLYHVKKDKSAK